MFLYLWIDIPSVSTSKVESGKFYEEIILQFLLVNIKILIYSYVKC